MEQKTKKATNSITKKDGTLLTAANEAEIILTGKLQKGISFEREAWLDTFYRIHILLDDGRETEVVIPGKVLACIKGHIGKRVVVNGKLLSKSDGKDTILYIMAKAARPAKKDEDENSVVAEGFVLSKPVYQRGRVLFNLMVPHYSGIHNIIHCVCDENVFGKKKMAYGCATKVYGQIVTNGKCYKVLVTKLS